MDEPPNPGRPPASLPASSHKPPLDDPRALQILMTEHSSLLASRSLAYNEAFSRTGMFLSFLSATLIVIGFLIGSLGLSAALAPIVAVLLLADLYVGAATTGRLIAASREELRCVRGMNRIRHAYGEIVPGLDPYFVTGSYDDARGVLATYGDVSEGSSLARLILHGLTTTTGMVATIDAMILGALCSLPAVAVGASRELAVLAGIVGFVVGFALFALIGQRSAMNQQARADSRFPSPGDPVR